MKYWILTTEYPPLFGGGISTYCYETATMFAEQGWEVTIFVSDEEVSNYEAAQQNNIRIVRFNPARAGSGQYLGYTANLSYAFALTVRQFIAQEGKPDCIESQEYLAVPYYLMQFRLLKYPELQGVPILLTLHSPAFLYLYYNREGIYSFPNYWTGEMEKSCIQCADWIIAPSQYIIDEIKKHATIDEVKTTVLANPFACTPVDTAGAPIERNKMVFFGKLSPQKGVFELFAYLKKMWDDGFPHPLTVIGGTEKVYYPEMKTMGQVIADKYAPYYKKGLVQMVGKIAPSRKPEYLRNAHVVLMPSMNDNLPYAVIEAMALGKVVLTSCQGGQRELITDGTDGFLFDHREPETFARVLQHILTLDNDQLKKIGDAAMQKVQAALNYAFIYALKSRVIETLRQTGTTSRHFPFVQVAFPFHGYPVADSQQGLLSVVIPYFNMGAYIRECLDSVVASTYAPVEIIIVNDGTTEQASIDRLKTLEGYPGLRIVHKKNEGVADTRNFGAGCARGEYIAFLDADDRVDPSLYAKAIPVLNAYENVAFVGSWVKYFGSAGGTWPTWNPEPPYILLHNSVNSSALVYKKAAFMHGGWFDKQTDYGMEDYESVINMLKHGYGGVVLPECLFFYRVRKDSMYRALTKYKILYSTQYIAGKHADFYSKFAPEIFALQNANGPSSGYDNPTFEVLVTSKPGSAGGAVNWIRSIVKRSPFLKKVLLRLANVLKLR